jgi:hypothetical protein
METSTPEKCPQNDVKCLLMKKVQAYLKQNWLPRKASKAAAKGQLGLQVGA